MVSPFLVSVVFLYITIPDNASDDRNGYVRFNDERFDRSRFTNDTFVILVTFNEMLFA